MLTDIEIASAAKKKSIGEIASIAKINEDALIFYGNDKAKIDIKKLNLNKKGKLILVTAINPTKAGEGKSTTSVGLVDSLNKVGINTIGCLREPSLGPVFGLKGGAAGGGYSQVIPMEDINLHFTGDMHAITSSNNLICACIDNHIFQGNELKIDKDNILFTRCLDINDRNLREISFKETKFSVVRDENFQITVASEIMAILCLSKDLEDLKKRVDNILIGFDLNSEPIYLRSLNITGSIAVLLKDAIKPNLVQTLENNPILIHGGPFANIAHGCNSIIATKTALSLSDVVVTEAGFGADLGFEKFVDIKSRVADIDIDLVVIVATIRALKLHGGVKFDDLSNENIAALTQGFSNLEKHIDTVNTTGLKSLVVINKFASDTDEEIRVLTELLDNNCVVSETFSKGSDGGLEMANKVSQLLINDCSKKYLYNLEDDVYTKTKMIATKVYGASDVIFSKKANDKLEMYKKLFDLNIPICIAKTPNSLSGDPKLLGRPSDFVIEVTDLKIQTGSGFLIVYVGGVMTMPGLGKIPNACKIDIDINEVITNLS